MDVRLATCASELTKIAAEQERKRLGYGSAMALALPYTAATAAADVPKGYVDKVVEKLIRGAARSKGESSALQAVGRGAGRLGAGLLTAPVFLSGIKDLKSDDPSRKRRGAAKVVGSGLVFSALKGGGEAAIANLKKDPGQIWKAIKGTAGARSIVGAGAALLTAVTVAKATKDSNKRKSDGQSIVGKIFKQVVVPGVVGTAAGAGKGAFEEAWTHTNVLKPLWKGKKVSLPSFRGIAAKSGGRAVAGALGAVVMTQAIKHLMPSKKNPQVKRWQKQKTAAASVKLNVGPSAGELYDQVRGWANDKNDMEVYKFYKRVGQQGDGERTPSRRAAFYALHDELSARGHEMPKPEMRSQVAPKLARSPGMADVAALGMIATAPAIAAKAVEFLPPTARDQVLEDALDRMIVQKDIQRKMVDPRAPWFDLPFDLNKAIGRSDARMGYSHYYVGPNAKGEVVEQVVLPPKGKTLPGHAAHELGHASSNILRQLMRSGPARTAGKVGQIASVILPMMAVEGTGDGSFTTAEELESRAKLVAGLGTVTGALQAPMIAEETLAQAKALKYLTRAGADVPEAVAKALLHTGPGYATYLIPAALPFIAAASLKLRAMYARSKK